MDRKLLRRTFTLSHAPDWVCPTCSKGVLRIKKESFHKDELTHSRDHSNDAWEPEWIEYVYSCLLYCTNDKCKEVVSSSGTGSADCYQDENGSHDYEDCFKPKYFEPALRIIKIPSSCPESVSVPLEESFRLFFTSLSAAANNIRVLIEQLLTELKIDRLIPTDKKSKLLNLHQRIELIPEEYSELKDLIFAIKWLGNAGSHGHGAVTLDDVMDGYELTEYILQEIYEPKAKKLKALAKKISNTFENN